MKTGHAKQHKEHKVRPDELAETQTNNTFKLFPDFPVTFIHVVTYLSKWFWKCLIINYNQILGQHIENQQKIDKKILSEKELFRKNVGFIEDHLLYPDTFL